MKNTLLSAAMVASTLATTARDLKTAKLYSGSSGTEVNGFGNLDVGYAHATLTDTAPATGGEFVARFELGAKFLFPARKENKSWMFSASAAYTWMELNPGVHKFEYRLFTLPLSIGQFSEGNNRKGRGFYWQIGTNINYVYKLLENDRNVKPGYASLFVEPFVSLGLTQPYLLMRGKEQVGGKRTLIGPFVSYLPGNLAKSPNTMTGWTLGLRWTSIITRDN
ncbi:MAG: hypothetical protein KF744_12935 [Taibaiella sp.]|nr:hypothetical protein [Taibaiella sp.]